MGDKKSDMYDVNWQKVWPDRMPVILRDLAPTNPFNPRNLWPEEQEEEAQALQDKKNAPKEDKKGAGSGKLKKADLIRMQLAKDKAQKQSKVDEEKLANVKKSKNLLDMKMVTPTGRLKQLYEILRDCCKKKDHAAYDQAGRPGGPHADEAPSACGQVTLQGASTAELRVWTIGSAAAPTEHEAAHGLSRYLQLHHQALPADQAVEQGADLVGELLIFSVALGVASLEYSRSAASARAKEAKQKELQLQEEREMEARFEYLEGQVVWLEDRLVELTKILESEMGARLELLVAEANRQKETPQKEQESPGASRLARRRQQRLDQNVHVGVDIDEKTAAEASTSVAKLWNSTYDAVAGLFK
ncbi:Dual specificity protein kinase shkD [Phytophthora nicotianae]|uniref:Dual specificity protein kinase shkD n=1 Tax=Phytophthora nicotianae TaxID=4792 RepID=A0A0W8DA05_PHYNI|nr:Dual specificity protein kinase shkD [Phytophthora nicotianae]